MKPGDQYGVRIGRALDVWVKLARAYATIQRNSADHVRAFHLTGPQFGVVECLGHKGPLTFSELSKKQLVSGGNMTVVVDNLEKEGIVERARCAEDRRQVYVRLTPKGKKLFERIFPQHADKIAKCMTVLNPEEQDRLAALLKKLGTGVSAAGCGEDHQSAGTDRERSRR